MVPYLVLLIAAPFHIALADAPQCEEPRSNLEINQCLHIESETVKSTYQKYVEEVRRIHYPEKSNDFQRTFEARVGDFKTYAQSKCDAVYEYHRPYTKAPTSYSMCLIELYQRETLDIWYDFLERQITNFEKPSV